MQHALSYEGFASERLIVDKIEGLFEQVKRLEQMSKDGRICTALRDAAHIVRARLRIHSQSPGGFIEDNFDDDDFNRH